MTNREPCSRWANESSNVGPPRVGSQRQRARAGASASLSLSQKITPQMILLSHERQCFSRTNQRSARRRPPHPLRRTESNRDLAYLIRTLLRFSMQTRTQAQLADFIGEGQSREARICSVRSDSSSGGLPSADRLHTSSRRIRAVSRGLQRSWQRPPAGRAGGRIQLPC
jgi:hypothetical protein